MWDWETNVELTVKYSNSLAYNFYNCIFFFLGWIYFSGGRGKSETKNKGWISNGVPQYKVLKIQKVL